MSQSEIILIRHGQANTGAQDEESYDKLSATGHQQSAWLGDYLRAQDTRTHANTHDYKPQTRSDTTTHIKATSELSTQFHLHN